MGGLHGGNDLQAGKAAEIGHVDNLRMFVAVAAGETLAERHGGKAIHGGAVGLIADGVDVDLETIARGLRDIGFQLVGRGDVQPARVRHVAVGCDQIGTATAERAIGDQLHRLHGDKIALAPRNRAIRRDRLAVVGAAGHRIDARRQLAGLGETHVAIPGRLIHAGIMRAGEADFGHGFQALFQHQIQPLFIIIGDDAGDQRHRLVDKHAGGVAGSIADDLAAIRRLGIAGDAGGFQSGRVGPAGVAINAREPGRAVTGDFIQFGSGGEAVDQFAIGIPAFLVPAAAHDPACCRNARLDAAQGFGDGGAITQIDHQFELAQPHHMAMGIDQARPQRGAGHVHLCAGGQRRAGFQRGLHLASFVHHQRRKALQFALAVERVAISIGVERVGKPRRGGGEQCGKDQFLHFGFSPVFKGLWP